MVNRAVLIVATLALAGSFLSCSSDEIDKLVDKMSKCEAKETQPCFCPSGASGYQMCNEDGVSWTTCLCADPNSGCTYDPEVCDGKDNDLRRSGQVPR